MMTFEIFHHTLLQSTPPQDIHPNLLALWYDGKGDWEHAHDIAQRINTSEGSWVHAYLHRKEGDNANAAYWYAKAGREFPKLSLDKEWEDLVHYFLESRLA